MKKFIYIFLIFGFLFCDKNSNPVNEGQMPPVYYKISGRVFYIDKDSLFIENAEVWIEGKKYLTDFNGFFKDDSLLKGKNTVKVSHPNFNTYEDELNIIQDTVINFQLTIKLETGKLFYAGSFYNKNGLTKWKIVNKEFEDGLTKYDVEDIFKGTLISGYGDTTTYDILYSFSDTNYFEITEDSLSNLVIYRNHFYGPQSFPRYYSSFELDTVWVSNLKYAKNIGMLKYNFWDGGVTEYYRIEYNLIDYTFVKN
jgi:hypothetical protein